jgi:predicted TIM-barrel fold metal-dependent hydrolase
MTDGSFPYRMIDADSHVIEPPDLWTSRVSQALQSEVPKIQRFEEGDAWVVPNGPLPLNFGFNVAAGVRRPERKQWVKVEEVPRAIYEPKLRLEAMDEDLVDACVLYPTPRLSQSVVAAQRPEVNLALVRAYNDWLSEYCSTCPERLGGVALMPNRGVADAVAELERVRSLEGIVGALIGCYPHGSLEIEPEDDALWQAVADAGFALHIHVGLNNDYPRQAYRPGDVAGDFRFLQAPLRMLEFIKTGVFDRVPGLRVVMGETDAGWVPYVKEQADNRLRRRSVGAEGRLARLPSEYIAEHFHYTYITDHVAIRIRDQVGVNRLMWSSDYPHSASDWPDSWRTIDADFSGVPRHERDLILRGNALSLYTFGGKDRR